MVGTSQTEESGRQPGRLKGAVAGAVDSQVPPLGLRCCESVNTASGNESI